MLRRPRLLDLFSGAGGCAVGYHRAGFDVLGVDNRPQPRYPFAFVRGDALEFVARYGDSFDAIHASPPYQRYSQCARISGNAESHPDLIAPVRELLIASGKHYVIENVPGAPLVCPALVCGLTLQCGVKRHRLFESNIFLFGTVCPTGHRGDYLSVFGGGAPAKADNRRRASAELARVAMGIDWMTRDELSQSIPPVYTCFIGTQLFRAIVNGKRARKGASE